MPIAISVIVMLVGNDAKLAQITSQGPSFSPDIQLSLHCIAYLILIVLLAYQYRFSPTQIAVIIISLLHFGTFISGLPNFKPQGKFIILARFTLQKNGRKNTERISENIEAIRNSVT